jgi:LVIVD repeat
MSMIARKILAGSGLGGERLLYAVGADNDPSRIMVVREKRSGELEYVGQWEAANSNYNLEDIMVGPDETYAYVASSDYDALIILDVSDPENIVETGRVSHATYLNRLYQLWADFENDVVFVKGNEYLASIDVSNKAAPVLLDHEYETSAQSLGVDGPRELAFTVRYSSVERLKCWDVSDPSSIVSKGVHAHEIYYDQGFHFDIDTVEMLVAVVPLGGVVTFTSYDAAGSLTWRSTYNPPTTSHEVRGVALDPARKIAFVKSKDEIGWWGILQLDYTDPAFPVELRFDRYEDLGVASSPTNIHFDPEWGRLILPRDKGFQTIDATNENALKFMGAFSHVDFHGCQAVRSAGARFK